MLCISLHNINLKFGNTSNISLCTTNETKRQIKA